MLAFFFLWGVCDGLETLLVFLFLVDREIVPFKRKSVHASMINGHQHGALVLDR